MTAAKIIWSGTYAGIDAGVRVMNGMAVPFLAGRVAIFPGDVGGVLGAAVLGLAIERDRKDAELRGLYDKRQDVLDGMTRAVEAEGRANKAFYEMQAERDELRERLAKLENSAAVVCLVRDLLDGTGHKLRESNAEFAALDRAIDDLVGPLQPLPQGAGDVET